MPRPKLIALRVGRLIRAQGFEIEKSFASKGIAAGLEGIQSYDLGRCKFRGLCFLAGILAVDIADPETGCKAGKRPVVCLSCAAMSAEERRCGALREPLARR